MADFYDTEGFLSAWRRGIALAGDGYFGSGAAADNAAASSKWELAPRTDLIRDMIGVLSSGESVFLAAMVSFYNARVGDELIRVATGSDAGFASVSAALDEPRRRVLADLLVSYEGW